MNGAAHHMGQAAAGSNGVVVLDWDDLILLDNPLWSWPFDDGSGVTARDISGNNLPGTYINGPTFITDDPFSEGGVQLNGTNQSIQRNVVGDTSLPSGAQPLAMEVLFRYDTDPPTALGNIMYYGEDGVPLNEEAICTTDTTANREMLYRYGNTVNTATSGLNLQGNVWNYGLLNFNGTSYDLFINSAVSRGNGVPASPNIVRALLECGAIRGSLLFAKASFSKFSGYATPLNSSQINARLALL